MATLPCRLLRQSCKNTRSAANLPSWTSLGARVCIGSSSSGCSDPPPPPGVIIHSPLIILFRRHRSRTSSAEETGAINKSLFTLAKVCDTPSVPSLVSQALFGIFLGIVGRNMVIPCTLLCDCLPGHIRLVRHSSTTRVVCDISSRAVPRLDPDQTAVRCARGQFACPIHRLCVSGARPG